MRIMLIVIGIVLLLGIVFVLWRFIVTIAATRRLRDSILDAVLPIAMAIENNEEPPLEQIRELAQRLDTRSMLYRILQELEKEDLMPGEYAALSAIAASDLSSWLMHPNELKAVPDDIELVAQINRIKEDTGEECSFFVFKYRTLSPHWAHENGWLAGVAGPYVNRKVEAQPPAAVFSRFEAIDSATTEEHLQKVETMISY